jgi:hypothetical protein
MNHNKPMNTWRRVFILMDAQTYLNTHVPCVANILRICEHPYYQI